MALSPPPSLTRSPPSSSNTCCSSERSSLDYPSPPELVDQQYRLSSIYGSHSRCSLTPPMDTNSPLPPLDGLCQPEWAGSTLLHPPISGAVMPSILSSTYDTFEGYESTLPPLDSHDLYQTPHPHSHHVLSSTSSSHGAILRSPDPSSKTTASFTSAPCVPGCLTPRIKMEQAGDYHQGIDLSNYPSPRSVHAGYATDSGSYTGSTSGYMSDGQSSWRTSDFQPPMESDHYYSSTTAPSPFVQDARRPYRAARPRRAPRRLTTREEANFQCEVKECGKLFSRSYNFKAHMETHDEKREYPFPCTANECTKKFVRKTDLQRHHQSVHMKERNHQCDYCARLFARKDTLRRHMEDGCSKRFNISTLDIGPQQYEGSQRSSRQFGVSPSDLFGPPPGGLPPMSIPPLGSNGSILTSTVPAVRSRIIDQSQGQSWPR